MFCNSLAKASFSAYLLGKILLKTGENVHFSTKKKHDQSWSSFLFLPFSLYCLKMAEIIRNMLFLLRKGQRGRQTTRPPPIPCKQTSHIQHFQSHICYLRHPHLPNMDFEHFVVHGGPGGPCKYKHRDRICRWRLIFSID